MEKLGTIYKIENLVNGKVYIGQTVRDYETRIKEHISKLNNGTHYNIHLQNAWNKYGNNNFKFTLLETCSISEIDKKEKEYISKYKVRKRVYNVADGGHYSKTLSKETIRKIAEKNYKPVVLLNTLEVFDSIKEASEKYGVGNQGITSCCRGDRKHAGRMPNGEWMVWRYKDEFDFDEKVSFKKNTANNKKQVICINTNEIFDSAKEASKKYGINPKNINSCCRGERKSCLSKSGKRLQFAFYDKGNDYKIQKIDKLDTLAKKVYCVTTKEVFDSMYQASKKYDVGISNISKCCKGIRSYAGKLPDGTKLKWAYYDDYLASK